MEEAHLNFVFLQDQYITQCAFLGLITFDLIFTTITELEVQDGVRGKRRGMVVLLD